jgi:hypothetical protein
VDEIVHPPKPSALRLVRHDGQDLRALGVEGLAHESESLVLLLGRLTGRLRRGQLALELGGCPAVSLGLHAQALGGRADLLEQHLAGAGEHGGHEGVEETGEVDYMVVVGVLIARIM